MHVGCAVLLAPLAAITASWSEANASHRGGSPAPSAGDRRTQAGPYRLGPLRAGARSDRPSADARGDRLLEFGVSVAGSRGYLPGERRGDPAGRFDGRDGRQRRLVGGGRGRRTGHGRRSGDGRVSGVREVVSPRVQGMCRASSRSSRDGMGVCHRRLQLPAQPQQPAGNLGCRPTPGNAAGGSSHA